MPIALDRRAAARFLPPTFLAALLAGQQAPQPSAAPQPAAPPPTATPAKPPKATPPVASPSPTVLPTVLTTTGTWPQRLHLKSDAAAVAAIENGLAWLRRHQDDDGRWGAGRFAARLDVDPADAGAGSALHDIAVTGLAVCALAREGKPPQGDPDRRAIDKATAWLVEQQDQNGRLGTNAHQAFIYDHAIGTLGLCAGAAATAAAPARDAAARAVAYLEKHRNPFMVWRYQPRDGDNDMSVTAWCTLACVAASELDIAVDPKVFESVRAYIGQLTDGDGRTGYTKRGEVSSRLVGAQKQFPPDRSETLSAAALLCRIVLGQTPGTEPALAKTADLLVAKPPVWRPQDGAVDHVCWFFGSEALRHFGGEPQVAWRKQLVAAAIAGQRRDGPLAGSWDPIDPWGKEGGRIYATALSVMALQSLYPGRSD